jgi:hypothetical protein
VEASRHGGRLTLSKVFKNPLPLGLRIGFLHKHIALQIKQLVFLFKLKRKGHFYDPLLDLQLSTFISFFPCSYPLLLANTWH